MKPTYDPPHEPPSPPMLGRFAEIVRKLDVLPVVNPRDRDLCLRIHAQIEDAVRQHEPDWLRYWRVTVEWENPHLSHSRAVVFFRLRPRGAVDLLGALTDEP